MLFELEEVCFHAQDKTILDKVDCSVREGECIAITGPSGAGKTTFLKLFNRLITPTGGKILHSGKPLAGFDVSRLRRNIGFLFQETSLIARTVGEALLLPFRFAVWKDVPVPGDKEIRRALAAGCFEQADLGQRTDTLSGGEKQRVAIARALLTQPKILLLDEPASGLDESARSQILQNIRQHLPGVTLLFVTHDRDLIARADRKLHFRDGKIALDIPINVEPA